MAMMDIAELKQLAAQSVQLIEVERWMQNVLGLIKQYGNECATEAYHGDLHCRKAPRDVFAEIEKEIAAELAASQAREKLLREALQSKPY